MKHFDIAVIGDGFCSLMIVAHLVRTSTRRIAVIGRTADWGPGLAYGACHPQHLLNVPAARMHAFPEDEHGFVNWLRAHVDAQADPQAFVPRRMYGDYLRSIAAEILQKHANAITYLTGIAGKIAFSGEKFNITSGTEKTESCALVLAAGVPQAVTNAQDPAEFMADPWATDFSVFEGATRPVVILGTGLTMIDVVSSLAQRNFKGKIAAVSRRGLLPALHAAEQDDTPRDDRIAQYLTPVTGSLPEQMRRVRANARACETAGITWQLYMDHLRPHVPELWAALSLKDQKKFLSCVAPYWNIHRHRQPRESAAMLELLRDAGQLSLHKGGVRWQQEGGKLGAHFADGARLENVSHVFNCRGPDYGAAEDAMMSSLRAQGLLHRHENGLGVRTDEHLSAAGHAQGKLYIAGCLTSGMFLDATSVPELRGQCAKIAKNLLLQ